VLRLVVSNTPTCSTTRPGNASKKVPVREALYEELIAAKGATNPRTTCFRTMIESSGTYSHKPVVKQDGTLYKIFQYFI
jgi:hypothetical protein